jgi:type II secretory pathway pseudopilin PulG
MNSKALFISAVVASMSLSTIAKDTHSDAHASVNDSVIAQQRQALAEATKGKGYGPQSPRDIELIAGSNTRFFNQTPPYTEMNLCDIHFHKNAEHKGGDFTKYAGNGDGQGYGSGYQYSGALSKAELAPVGKDICPSKHGGLKPGDTIELHYVYSSAQAVPGPTLGTCLSDAITNPQLRVEAQVFVLMNDKNASDFV